MRQSIMRLLTNSIVFFLFTCSCVLAQEVATVSVIEKQILPEGKIDTQIIDVPDTASFIRFKLDRSFYTDETQVVSIRPEISYDGGQKWQDLSGGFDTIGGDYLNEETGQIQQFSYSETSLDQMGNKNRKIKIAVTVGKKPLETACEIEFK